MARKVDAFPEIPTSSKYPWTEWFDGSVWELTHGDDFKGKPNSFKSMAKTRAKRLGGTVKTRLLKGRDGTPDRLYLQYRPAEDAPTPMREVA